MRRWHGLDSLPDNWRGCVATIGVFDGVHRGHQRIIRRAVWRAREAVVPAVVLTFEPHPAAVLRPGSEPARLSGPELKASLLNGLGVDAMVALGFTAELSRLEPDEFVRTVVVERLGAVAVVVGENFRFGHRAAGTVATLHELGRKYDFDVEGVPLVQHEEGTGSVAYSSTYVRTSLADGDVEAAARALGRPHRIEGTVIHGHQRGKSLGFPTANVECAPGDAVPADGVYAGWLIRGDDRWPAAVSIGTNPTFGGQRRGVEAYALDHDDLDLYGEYAAVEFVARLRDTLRFDSAEQLVAAMREDVERTRAITASDAS